MIRKETRITAHTLNNSDTFNKGKIFFTDLDGTLLNDAKEITPKTRSALDHIAEHHHRLVLISGRPVKSVLEVKDSLHLDYPGMYLIAYNGGCIYDCDNERYLMEKRISLEDTAHILQTAQECGVYCHTYTDTHIITGVHGSELDYYRRTVHLPFHVTDNIINMLDKPPYKLLAISLDDKRKLEHFRDTLSTWVGDKLQMIFSNDNYLELFPYHSGKGAALTYLADYLGIPIENTLSAGDADNDVSMILAAGTGVAMINGAPSVQNAADVITKYDNNHDGLAEILLEFF